jgi:hypothetical protein
MSTPSEQLAINVIERLVKEKLLLQDDGKKMLLKLAEGKLRGEDWQLPIEKAAEKEVKVQK